MTVKVSVLKRIKKGKIPRRIAERLQVWITSVEDISLESTIKINAWRDHALRGDKKGRRAIYLNKQWRAEYEVKQGGSVEFVEVEEVHAHDY